MKSILILSLLAVTAFSCQKGEPKNKQTMNMNIPGANERQYAIEPSEINQSYYGADLFIGNTSTGEGVWLVKPPDSNIMYFEQQVYLNVTTMGFQWYVFPDSTMDWYTVKSQLQVYAFGEMGQETLYSTHPFVAAFIEAIPDTAMYPEDVEVWVRCCNDTATGDSCWVRIPELCTSCAVPCGIE